MNRSSISLAFGLLACAFIALAPAPSASSDNDWNDSTPVWDILEKLGVERLNAPKSGGVEGADAEKGRQLVELGYTTNPKGKRTSKQSPFYTCIACHNTTRESADLADNSPEARLEYSKRTGTPFIQGSTFFGIVNRTNFYNDEYQLKYAMSEEIVAAYKDLRQATNVCATQCSQGRALEEWELESIILYFWSLELKMGDLKLTAEEREKIKSGLSGDRFKVLPARDVLYGKYARTMPAHFVPVPAAEPLPDSVKRDARRMDNGRAVYRYGCMFCHGERRFSSFPLDTSALSLRYLRGKIGNGKRADLYKLTRAGVYSNNGHCNSVTCTSDPSETRGPAKAAYMPEYTIEKMSAEQLIDLRVYIENLGQMPRETAGGDTRR